jgi:hypothetical protein
MIPYHNIRFMLFCLFTSYLFGNLVSFVFIPGFLGVRSITDISQIEVLITGHLKTKTPSWDDIEELIKDNDLECHLLYDYTGRSRAYAITSNGATHGILCNLPRFWVESDSLGNIIFPKDYNLGFHFNINNIVVDISVSDPHYFW